MFVNRLGLVSTKTSVEGRFGSLDSRYKNPDVAAKGACQNSQEK